MLCSVYIYTYGAHAVCVSLQQGWISAQLLSLPLTTHPQVQTGWVSATLLVLLYPLGFLGCFFQIVYLILFPGILPSVFTHKWFFVWNTLCFFLLCFHIPQLCHSSVFCSFQRNLVVSHLCENYPHNFFFSFFFTWLPCIYPFFNFILLLCFVHTALNPSSPPVCYSSLCVQGLGYSISDTVHPWVASILLKCYRTPDL